MARINIDDSIYKDVRFVELVGKTGGLNQALGALVRAWGVGQKYWARDKGLIPSKVWKSQKLDDSIIEVGLAEQRDDGVYIRGSAKQFGWLLQKVEAGRKGGQSKSANTKSNKTIEEASVRQASAKRTSSAAKPLTLTPSLPLSSSSNSDSRSTSKESKNYSVGAKSKSSHIEQPALDLEIVESEKPKKGSEAVALYCREYKERYKNYPLVKGKAAGQLNTLFKDLGFEKFEILVKAYIKMLDHNFVKNHHDVTGLVLNINKIWNFAQTGKMFTNTQLNQLDKDLTHANLLKTIREGKLNE